MRSTPDLDARRYVHAWTVWWKEHREDFEPIRYWQSEGVSAPLQGQVATPQNRGLEMTRFHATGGLSRIDITGLAGSGWTPSETVVMSSDGGCLLSVGMASQGTQSCNTWMFGGRTQRAFLNDVVQLPQ